MRFIILSIGLIILATLSSNSQELYDWFYFPLTVEGETEDGKVRLRVEYGKDFGIEVGQSASIWSTYFEDNPERSSSELGNGKVTEVGANFTLMEVSQYAPIINNDLAAFYLAYPSINKDIIGATINRITFNDLDGNPFFSFGEIINSSDSELEKRIFEAMAEDIKRASIKYQKLIDDRLISIGVYAGSTMFGRMDSTTVRDITSYIRFANAYPAKYMGKSWNIAETYADWLISYGSQHSDDDLYKYFIEYSNRSEVPEYYFLFKDELTEDHIIDWGSEPTYVDYDSISRFMSNLRILSDSMADDTSIGWANYLSAEYDTIIYEKIEFLLTSVKHFRQANHNKGLGYTYISIGEGLVEIDSVQLAISNFKLGQYYFEQSYQSEPRDNRLNEDIRASYLLGDAYLDIYKYDSSIYYFKNMLEGYTQIEDENNITISNENLALAYSKAGNCDLAIEHHIKRIPYYEQTENLEDLADVYFDIGFVYNGYCDYYEKGIPYYEKAVEYSLAIGDTSTATLSQSNIGQSYWSLRELDKAIENHLRAIDLAEKSKDVEKQISSLSKLADLYKENGNPKKGFEAYDKILALYEKIDNQEELASSYNDIGDLYYDAKDYLKAIDYYVKATEYALALDDKEAVQDNYFDLAQTYFAFNKFQEAISYYQKSINISEEIKDKNNIVYCQANISVSLTAIEEYEKADSTIEKAVKIAEQIGDKTIYAFCLARRAASSERITKYELADSLYSVALEMYYELKDLNRQSMTLQSLASLKLHNGEFEEAEKMIYEAKRIAEEDNNRNNIADCLTSLSDLQTRVYGEFDKAWENQMEANKIYEEVDNIWRIAGSYVSTGNILNLQGDYVNAIKEYEKSDSLYKILNNSYNRATPVNNIGTIYFWQGDYEKGLEYFYRALAMMDSIGVKDDSRTLYVGNIGEVYFEQGKYDLAEKWLTQALNESRENNDVGQVATNLYILGEMYTNQKKYEIAKASLHEAYRIAKGKNIKTILGTSEFNLGKLYYELKNTDSAQYYINTSIESSKSIGSDKELWEAYYYRGLIAREAGRLGESREALINAIESLERIQSRIVGGAEAKKLFASGERQVEVYSTLVDVLIELGEVELAMQYLERSNVESLRNRFAQLNIQFQNDEVNESLKKERELKKKLDNIDRTLTEERSSSRGISSEKLEVLEKNRSVAENEYLKFVNTTINTNPELAKHFSGGFHPRKLKTDKNRRLIPEELIVLSFLPSDEKLYIFAATSDTVIAKVVPVGLEDLSKNINYMYNFTSKNVRGHNTDALRLARGDDQDPLPPNFNTDQSNYKNISNKLYQWLLAPVIDEIDKKELVAVIPTGVLHFLPFQQLGKVNPNGKFEYFIEHYTLFYTHTLEMLYQHTEQPEEISILAFGNADNSLPASEEEVNDLKAIYPTTEVLLRNAATENKVKSNNGDHNILHFATHGNLDYYDYNKSYLTLAPDESTSDDGKLTIEEVWEIEDIYSYQMVTLSACQTAVTQDYSTGWAVSPASSFIDAGTPTVVASLWAVNDASTALLMKYFYENLKTMQKVDALRYAQIKLSNHSEYSHPYYWSPFILIGNWK